MHGNIEIICGPMFSGKSEELLRRLRRVNIAGNSPALFKPSIDRRYSEKCVVSHDKRSQEATRVVGITKEDLMGIENEIDSSEYRVVAFDEVHFFDPYIIQLFLKWSSQGRRVIASGLDMDFRGEPFGPMPQLLAIADKVDKLKAICLRCKGEAGMSQRIVNGRPAKYNEKTVLVAGTESYEARCKTCHEISR